MEAKNVEHEIQFRDIEQSSLSGWLGLFIHLIIVPVAFLSTFILYGAGGAGIIFGILAQIVIAIIWTIMWNSYVIINPNEAAVLQFFGKYVGSVKTEGFRWFILSLIHI